ncbi:MAG TPA: DUF2459 domain-containing protein [Aliidongia sp.]|uniref:DUF2459 domain-containing protein n=1 Tax=Aliidongia sp. TaxID=1914230 RepID=UPI002DDC9665|nr:DUF2459 domain-containing protein [Aliidongia sp.]HEV2674664.1 DUF2459 domain-containing protein [Aliidongia sp.]
MVRLLCWLIASVTGLVAGYVGLGFGLGALATGDAPPAGRVALAVIANTFHSDLVFPVTGAGVDWTALFELPPEARYVAIGWGNRRFYMETPQLSDLKLATVATALTGTGDSVLHVAWYPGEPMGDAVHALDVTGAQAEALARYVAQFAARDEKGRTERFNASYGADDAFFAASGRWSPILTCNEWLGRGLRAARIRTGIWTPFADGILRHLPTAALGTVGAIVT